VERDLDILSKMMSEQDGLWDITSSRVDVISNYLDHLSPSMQETADQMLQEADGTRNAWVMTTERFRLLRAIAASVGRPGRSESSEILEEVIRGASYDQVLDRPWVKSAIDLIRRMAD